MLARHAGVGKGWTVASAFRPVVPALAGYYGNGTSALALKAALTRVKGGTGRGRCLFLGNSLTAGAGGGTTADSSRLTGARPNRISAVLASLYAQAGVPALDGGLVGDACVSASSVTVDAYDPRLSFSGPAWVPYLDRTFAGGSFLQSRGGIVGFAPGGTSDTAEIVLYNAGPSTIVFDIDGSSYAQVATPPSPPTTGTSITSSNGFAKVTLRSKSAGAHAYQLACTTADNTGALASIMTYNSAVPALDFIVAAAAGATTSQLAGKNSFGASYGVLDYLAFVAPDLVIVEAGTNDMIQGVSTATFANALQAIIAAAQAIGASVLVVFPTPTSAVSDATLQSYNAAAKATAATAGVAFLSLYERYGPFTSAFGARLADGTTHPGAPLYAEIAGVEKQALDIMAA